VILVQSNEYFAFLVYKEVVSRDKWYSRPKLNNHSEEQDGGKVTGLGGQGWCGYGISDPSLRGVTSRPSSRVSL